MDDTAARSVFADWLESKGDPRGALMALALAGKDAEAKAMIEAQADVFLGPLAPHQKEYDYEARDAFMWKYGFIHAARLSHNHYTKKLDGKLADVLRALLAHDSGHFLTELTLTFNNDPNEDNLQELIDVLAEQPRPMLRKLHLGDFKYAGAARDEDRGEDTEISWYSVGDLSRLWPALPRLETLIIQTGSATSAIGKGTILGALDLPALRRLEYRTGGLEAANAQALVTAKLPAIEHLDLWFGQENYGGTAGADELGTLLARTDLPKLRHLGIMNAEFIDDAIDAIAKSALLPQLTELDLSLGCLTDGGATALSERRAAFAHLARLDVSHSYLTDAGKGALQGIARSLEVAEQRDAGDDRYAAVGE